MLPFKELLILGIFRLENALWHWRGYEEKKNPEAKYVHGSHL